MPQGCKNPNILKMELSPKIQYIFRIAVYKGVCGKLHQELKLPKRSIKVFFDSVEGLFEGGERGRNGSNLNEKFYFRITSTN